MNLIDRIVNNSKGYFAEQGIRLMRYADDFILMGRRITEEAVSKIESYLARMELNLNTE